MILLERYWFKEYIIMFLFERNINVENEAIETESLSRESPLDTTV